MGCSSVLLIGVSSFVLRLPALPGRRFPGKGLPLPSFAPGTARRGVFALINRGYIPEKAAEQSAGSAHLSVQQTGSCLCAWNYFHALNSFMSVIINDKLEVMSLRISCNWHTIPLQSSLDTSAQFHFQKKVLVHIHKRCHYEYYL